MRPYHQYTLWIHNRLNRQHAETPHGKVKTVRRRTLILLLLPALLFLWVVGWSMYWTGNQQTTSKQGHKKERKDVEIIPNLLYEQEIPQ
jgi:flagellar basal body-associated protein FliL